MSMKIGDRVRPSPAMPGHLRRGEAVVVRPGVSRGGSRIHLLIDGDKKPGSWASRFWEVKPS